MITLEEIKQAYSALKEATKQYWHAKNYLMQQERIYETVFNHGLYSGQIVGKNEAERLGHFYALHSNEVDDYLDAKEEEALAKMNLELAKIDVEQIQSSLAYLTIQEKKS